MKRKLLTTTLLSISLLSLNLSAAGKMKCTGTNCFIDISGLSPAKEKVKPQKNVTVEERYKTIILDNIETIVFSKYEMTEDEIAEYDLENIFHDISTPTLNKDNLPNSDYYCEDDLKPIIVKHMKNTYECA